jgi:hypothetical protein
MFPAQFFFPLGQVIAKYLSQRQDESEHEEHRDQRSPEKKNIVIHDRSTALAQKFEIDTEAEYRHDPGAGENALFTVTGKEQVDAENERERQRCENQNIGFADHRLNSADRSTGSGNEYSAIACRCRGARGLL